MNFNELTENTIYLSNFFNDVETSHIIYADAIETLFISDKATSFIELLENLTDLGISTDCLIGKAIQKRYFQTIRSYYEKLSDSMVKYVKVI